MPKITFMKNYEKFRLRSGEYATTARLIALDVIPLSSLSRDFLQYDTNNFDYKFGEQEDFIILTFFVCDRSKVSQSFCFTTLRPANQTKYIYYRQYLQQEFDLDILNSDAK